MAGSFNKVFLMGNLTRDVEFNHTPSDQSVATIGLAGHRRYTTKDGGKGSGLGLSMVHRFLNQSGGHLSINSKQGKGTTISLYVPLTEEKANDAADPFDS